MATFLGLAGSHLNAWHGAARCFPFEPAVQSCLDLAFANGDCRHGQRLSWTALAWNLVGGRVGFRLDEDHHTARKLPCLNCSLRVPAPDRVAGFLVKLPSNGPFLRSGGFVLAAFRPSDNLPPALEIAVKDHC